LGGAVAGVVPDAFRGRGPIWVVSVPLSGGIHAFIQLASGGMQQCESVVASVRASGVMWVRA